MFVCPWSCPQIEEKRQSSGCYHSAPYLQWAITQVCVSVHRMWSAGNVKVFTPIWRICPSKKGSDQVRITLGLGCGDKGSVVGRQHHHDLKANVNMTIKKVKNYSWNLFLQRRPHSSTVGSQYKCRNLDLSPVLLVLGRFRPADSRWIQQEIRSQRQSVNCILTCGYQRQPQVLANQTGAKRYTHSITSTKVFHHKILKNKKWKRGLFFSLVPWMKNVQI